MKQRCFLIYSSVLTHLAQSGKNALFLIFNCLRLIYITTGIESCYLLFTQCTALQKTPQKSRTSKCLTDTRQFWFFRHLFGSVLHCERTLLGAQSMGIYKYSDKHILTGSLCFKGSHKTPPDNEPSSRSRFTMKCFGVEETIWFFPVS